MPSSKVISSSTIITSFDVVLEIYTFYDGSIVNCNNEEEEILLPEVLDANIQYKFGLKNGIPYKEGELLITANNMPSNIDMFLNSKGDLNIVAVDREKYFIDSNGYLQYTLCN